MVSEAKKRANRKYAAKTYKNLQVSAKIADYEKIDKFSKENDISKAQLIIKSVMYCIDNNINLKD